MSAVISTLLTIRVAEALVQDTTSAGASVIPFPFVFYTPETGLAFGATIIVFKTLAGTDRPSSLQPTFVYSVKKQVIASLASEVYLAEGDMRLVGELAYMRFPNTFWGIGNDAPDLAEEDYTPRLFSASLGLQRRVHGSWFVGGNVLAAHRRLLETEAGGLLATATVPGSADGLVVSLGISLTSDSRDHNIYPRRGGYHQLKLARFDGMIGSDYEFTTLQIDARKYFPVGSQHVLVVRGLIMETEGVPPFELLPQLGGESLLRGYFSGRYREQSLLALQTEYRTQVVGRLGAVGFAGVGQVADALDAFALDRFKTSFGMGLRFLLSSEDHLNLRADFGFGEGSSGFYLGMGEVF